MPAAAQPGGNAPLAIRRLLAQAPTPERLEQFVTARDFPLVSEGHVSFVWIGEAERVELLRWIHSGVVRTAFSRIDGTELWLLDLPVQDGGRFEYKLSASRNGHEHWMLDPLNPVSASDPFGHNSVCRTFGYSQPAWSLPQGSPPGSIQPLQIQSPVFDELREEQVYLPADYDANTPVPLLIIHDGPDFMTYADLSVSLDNLIAAGAIPPLIAALVQTHDRMGEYSRGRRHARYLVHELLPQLEERYSLSGATEHRILLGASLGAVAALATVLRYPGIFGGVVLQSGTFILDEARLAGRPHPVFRRVARLLEAFRRRPVMHPLRAYISTGELEGLASESQALAELLQTSGVSVKFQSAWDGHHWHNWRDRLRDGLVWVLGGADKSGTEKT